MIQTKSYFANAVEEALALARQELGDEALLVESKRSRPGEDRLGAYEVVVAAPEREAATMAPTAGSAQPAQDKERLSREFAGLRLELERMSGLLTHVAANTIALRRAEIMPLVGELARADLAPELIQQIVRRIPENVADGQEIPLPSLREYVLHDLENRIRCEPRVGRPGAARKIVALVGPPGAGKTTALVKLAMRHRPGERLSTAFITTDTYRIAAADQLKVYAAILGAPCAVVEHGGALTHALEAFRHKELVLIDTPGFSAGDWDLAVLWGRYLLAHPEIDTHLVLSATTRSADQERLLNNWRAFDPQCLLFSHLDETPATGGIVSAAVASGLPVSFLSTGQSVPEDFEPAAAAALLAFLAKPEAARSAAA